MSNRAKVGLPTRAVVIATVAVITTPLAATSAHAGYPNRGPAPTVSPGPVAPAAQSTAALVAGRPAFLNASAGERFQQGQVVSSGGLRYVPYQRLYAGLPEIGGDFVVVTTATGQILSHSTALSRPVGEIATTAKLTSGEAAAVATRQLRSVDSVEGTRLVVDARGTTPRLAWESTVDGRGAAGISRLTVDVDAVTGQVLHTQEHVMYGSGTAAWNGPNPVPLSTSSSLGTFRLQDPIVANMPCQDSASNATFTGPDDVWGNGVGVNRETGCVDALFGAQTEVRMLSQWLGRNAMDGNGGAWPIRVGLNDLNAFYDGTQVQIGHNAAGQWIGSTDVIAHEMGHGIDDHTPGSISQNGTQEFIADAFGAATEWFANEPAPFDVPDFTVGEQVNVNGAGPIRIMYNPSLLGDPNCYSSSIPTTEVHSAAGPGNHWFYLLAEGSSPTNGQPASPTCNNTAVSGIGVQNTIRILYNAMLMKTSLSSYPRYRTWTLQAAINLFPGSCNQFNAVKAAWDAVSVPSQVDDPGCGLDGSNRSHPSVLGSPNAGNLAVFFNSNGRPAENFYFVSSNQWGGPFLLPGTMSGPASPVAIGDPNGGNVAVFFNSGGNLAYDYYLGATNQWVGPFVIANDIQGDPTVLGNPNSGNLAVFYWSSQNTLKEDYYFVATNTWSGSFPVATAIDATPTAIGDPNQGNIAVFYTSNGILLESYYFSSSNQWIGPFALATGVKGAPMVLGSPNAGNLAVLYMFSNGTTNQMREIYYFVSTNSWVGPWGLPGNPTSAPATAAIGSPNSGNIALFFTSGDHSLVEDVYQVAQNTWVGPVGIGGGVKGLAQPTAVGDPNGGNMAVFFTGINNALTLNYFLGTPGIWTGPMLVGGTIT